MNNHQFYCLLENKIHIPLCENGIYNFSNDFIINYNKQINLINDLKINVLNAIDEMTKLEKEHLKIITEQREIK